MTNSPKPPSVDDARAALESSVAELLDRVQPAALAADAKERATAAVKDAGAVFTGGGLPEDDSRRRGAIALLATGGAVALLTLRAIVRRARSH